MLDRSKLEPPSPVTPPPPGVLFWLGFFGVTIAAFLGLLLPWRVFSSPQFLGAAAWDHPGLVKLGYLMGITAMVLYVRAGLLDTILDLISGWSSEARALRTLADGPGVLETLSGSRKIHASLDEDPNSRSRSTSYYRDPLPPPVDLTRPGELFLTREQAMSNRAKGLEGKSALGYLLVVALLPGFLLCLWGRMAKRIATAISQV